MDDKKNPWIIIGWIIVGILAYLALGLTLAWVYLPTRGIPGL